MRARKFSGNIAKNRLEHMILSDKMQVSPEVLVQMKREMRMVLRKYMNTEYVRLEVQLRFISETKQGEEDVKTVQIKGL